MEERRRAERIGYVVVAAGFALLAAWTILPGSPTSSLGLALLCAAAVLGLLGVVALALENRLSLVFGLSFCVSLVGLIAAGSFNAPDWLDGVAIGAMLVAWGGFLFGEPLSVAAKRFVEQRRGASRTGAPSRYELGDLLHQGFLVVAFAAIVAAALGHGGAADALFAAAFGVVLVSALLRLPVGRRGLIQGIAWIVGTTAAIILIYVVRARAASDAVLAISVVVVAAVAPREARRSDRR